MLVYIEDRDDKGFDEHREYAYVYEYDDYDYEEENTTETNDYEINEVDVDEYFVS